MKIIKRKSCTLLLLYVFVVVITAAFVGVLCISRNCLHIEKASKQHLPLPSEPAKAQQKTDCFS